MASPSDSDILEPAHSTSGLGIGMENVVERLRALYGGAAHMHIGSRNGPGTIVTLDLPLVDEDLAAELSPPKVAKV